MYWFFIWRNLNPLHPRMLCAKIGWNWLSGSGEEDFLISFMYYGYYVIISPWKRVGVLQLNKWIPFTQGSFVSSLVKTGPVVLGERMKMWKVYNDNNGRQQTDDGRQAIRKAHLSFQLRWAKNGKVS